MSFLSDHGPALFMALLGGTLVGVASLLLLWFHGRIAGISGIVGGLLDAAREEFSWRMAFIAGLVIGGLVMLLANPGLFSIPPDRSTGALVVAGLLVGFGTRLGSGCTSGHGICGLSRLSVRSLVAVLTFMASGAATVFFVRVVLGGVA